MPEFRERLSIISSNLSGFWAFCAVQAVYYTRVAAIAVMGRLQAFLVSPRFLVPDGTARTRSGGKRAIPRGRAPYSGPRVHCVLYGSI